MPATKQTPAKRKSGRPLAIGPDVPHVADRIIALIEGNNRPEAAAATAGVSKETLYASLRHGRRVIDGRVPKGHRLTEKDRYLASFSDRYARALGHAETGTIGSVMAAGLAESVETRTTRKLIGTVEGPDGRPEPIYAEEVTTIRRPPDVANLRWVAERRFDAWAPKTRNEHSGPGGGPIPVELQVEGLMAKWAAARDEAGEDRPELGPGGEVIDVAEVVEE